MASETGADRGSNMFIYKALSAIAAAALGAAIVLARQDLVPGRAITICGWGTSNDANHMTGPSRDGSGLAQAIRSAFARMASRI